MAYRELIEEKLKCIGESYDLLKPNMIKHLESIEDLIQEKLDSKNEAINVIKNTNLTLSYISNELNMSRTTLYNHEQLLKRYIDYSVEQSNSSDPYYIISSLKEEKTQLNKEIGLLMRRDLDMEILKMQNEQLKKELNEKSKEIERLHKRVTELSIIAKNSLSK